MFIFHFFVLETYSAVLISRVEHLAFLASPWVRINKALIPYIRNDEMSRAFLKSSSIGCFPHFPWSVEVNGKRLFKEMKDSISSEKGNYRALGRVVREHRAQIRFLMLQWPQYDSLIPKVMPVASPSANQLCTLTPTIPHPITTHTASP